MQTITHYCAKDRTADGKSSILTICRSRKHESKYFYWLVLSGDGILKRQTFVLQNNGSQRKLTALNNNSKNAQKKRALTRVFQNALTQNTCVRFACALARYLWPVLYVSTHFNCAFGEIFIILWETHGHYYSTCTCISQLEKLHVHDFCSQEEKLTHEIVTRISKWPLIHTGCTDKD